MGLLAGNRSLINFFSWKEPGRSHGSAAIHSFIHSLNYFSVFSFVPGTVPASENARIKDTQSLHSWSLQSRIQQRNKPNKQTNIIIYVFIYTYIYVYMYTYIATRV